MIDHPDPIVRTLAAQVYSLRRQVQEQGELLDTLATPPWKKIWFVIQGYKLWRIGRWRKQRWCWEI